MATSTRNIIYGPPGTGKTTKLISIMEDYLAKGGKAQDICFTSFTKRSIEEAKERVKTKFGFDERDLRMFRTMHSLCMSQAGLRNSDVVQFSDKKYIAKLLGLEITYKRVIMDGTNYGMKDGDKMFHLSDYHRAKKVTLEQAWEETGREVDWQELKQFHQTYEAYKQDKLLVDFTDMLTRFMKEGYSPPVDLLFVDEAQDLSSLQWEAVFKLETNAKKTYIAGDDDQAIYGWNGANVQTFINLEGERLTLDKSHRLNHNVHFMATNIIKGVQTRVEKLFTPRPNCLGTVMEVHYLEDLNLAEGQWLLLARNGYLLQEYEEHCLEMGYIFNSARGVGPTKSDEFKAIIAWEKYRKGEGLSAKELELISSLTTRENPLELTNLPWFDLLNLMAPAQKQFFRKCRENKEKLFEEPRIQINTIHGVKGGEAQNVCIMSDVANTTWKNLETNPDEEFRVFYVGVTRAIDNLFLKAPKTNKYFDFWVNG